MITMRLKTRNTAPDDDDVDGKPALPVSRRSALSRHFASARGRRGGEGRRAGDSHHNISFLKNERKYRKSC